MSKKVLFLIDSMGVGGAERVLSNIIKGLDRNKYLPILCLTLGRRIDYYIDEDVEVCTIEPVTGKCFDAFVRMITLPIVCYWVVRYTLHGKKRFNWKMLYSILFEFSHYVFGLRSVIKKYRPDLIMTVLFNSSMIASLYCQYFRDSTPLCLSDHNTLSIEVPRLYPSVDMVLTEMVLRRADRYVAVSKGVMDDLITVFGFPCKLIDVIYNGIDFDQIKVEAARSHPVDLPIDILEKRCPLIVSVGRLTAQKGQNLLLKAFRLVLDKVESRLVILGEGENLDALQQLAADLRIKDKVLFLGWRRDLFPILFRCDVFALSSLYEAFPMVLLEAMALGLPVVASDCPHGPFESLDAGRYGILVPAGSYEGLAAGILQVLTDKCKMAELSRLSQARAAEFTLVKMASDYDAVFERLMKC